MGGCSGIVSIFKEDLAELAIDNLKITVSYILEI